jgi:predicted DNA-binding transcriptional regulator AlpA
MKMATTTTSPWLKVSEVLEELSIGRSTFDLWRAEGRAPRCYKLPNGQLRIKRTDLDAWLSELEEVAA